MAILDSLPDDAVGLSENINREPAEDKLPDDAVASVDLKELQEQVDASKAPLVTPTAQTGVEDLNKIDPKLVEQAAGFDKELNRQARLDSIVGDVADASAAPVKFLLDTSMLPAKALSGAASRVSTVANELTNPGITDPQRLLDGFLNPDTLRLARARSGRPEKIQDLFAELKSRNAPISEYVNVIGNELTPNVVGQDVVSQGEKQDLMALLPNEVPEGAREFTTDLALNVALDPMTYSSFFSRVPRAAAELGEAQDIGRALKDSGYGSGLARDVNEGRRALYQFKVPGDSAPLFTIKGENVAKALDDIGTSAEKVLGIRPLMQRSGFQGFDLTDGMYNYSSTVRKDAIDTMKDLLITTAGPNATKENVVRYASVLAEHGDNVGPALAKKMGIKIAPDEINGAKDLTKFWNGVNEFGNGAIEDAGGTIPKSPSIPDLEQRSKMLDDLYKKYPDIPEFVVTGEDGKNLNFAFGRSNYDFGRALKEEAKQARATQDALNDFRASTNSLGLKPSSFKSREDFSTEVYNAILGEKYGVKEPFNPNKNEVVLNNLRNKLEVADKLKFVDAVKQQYGILREDIPQVIEQAKSRISQAREMGIPPHIEDLRMSKLEPKDFRTLNDDVWNEINHYTKDSKTFQNTRDLYYPDPIADRVESKFYQPSTGTVAKTLAWIQKQNALNMLLSPFRFGKQSVENFSKAFSLGVTPADVMTELSMVFSKGDKIKQMADALPTVSESAYSLPEFKKQIGLSVKMITDPETTQAVDAFYGGMHNLAKDGKLDKSLTDKGLSILKKAATLPASIVELANENRLSQAVRTLGNSSDALLKRAYFRKLLNEGVSPAEAMLQVGDHLLDFESTTNTVRNLRYVLPFASFQIKNAETMIPLLFMKPGVANVVNPWDGHFRRAIEDTNGWSPQDYQILQKAFPFYRDPVLGPILRGQQTILANKDSSQGVFDRYVQMFLGPNEQKKLDSGLQLSLMVPSAWQAASDALNPMRATENFSSPLVSAAMIGFYGMDPRTREFLKTKGTDMEAVDRITGAMRTLNPLYYPRLVNQVFPRIMPEFSKNLKDYLRQSPVTREASEIMGFKIGSGNKAQDDMRMSEDSINAITEAKFLGMGRLTKADQTFWLQQQQLTGAADEISKRLNSVVVREGKEEALRYGAALKRVYQQMDTNAKIWRDYTSRVQKLGGYMDPEVQKELNASLMPDENTVPQEAAVQDQIPQDSIPLDDLMQDEEADISQGTSRNPSSRKERK